MTSYYSLHTAAARTKWLSLADLDGELQLPVDSQPVGRSVAVECVHSRALQQDGARDASSDSLGQRGHADAEVHVNAAASPSQPVFKSHNGHARTERGSEAVNVTVADALSPAVVRGFAKDADRCVKRVDENGPDAEGGRPQALTLYGRSVRRAALAGVDADTALNSATSLHVRLGRALSGARDHQQILEVLDQSIKEFDSFHCVLAVHRLARHGRLLGAPGILAHRQWPLLTQRLRGVVDAKTSEPRQLASIVWAFANLRYPDRTILEAVAQRAVNDTQSADWDPMSLSLLPQGFAMLHAKHAPLLSAISSRMRKDSSESWGPGDVSRIVWAWAKLQHHDDVLFRDVSCKLLSRLPECSPGILAQTIWAFATVGPKETAESHLFPRLAQAMGGTALKEHTAAHLAMVVWAFAAVLFRPVDLLEEIGDTIPAKQQLLNSQDISMIAWSYAALLAPQRSVFSSLADAAVAAVGNFNAQDLANTAWAFATAGEYSASLLDALGNEACRRSQDFNYQHSAMLIWSYVTLKHRHDPLYAMVGQIAEVDRSSWSSAKLLAYALAGLPRLRARLGTRAATLRIAAGLVASLLERQRSGLGEPDDAHTVHDAVFPLLDPVHGASELPDTSMWLELEQLVDAQRRRLQALPSLAVFEAILPRPGVATLTYDVNTVREYQSTVQSLGLRGLGSAHTWKFLLELEARRAPSEFVQEAVEALRRPEPPRLGQEPGRGERANRCYWRVQINAPGPDGVRRLVEQPGRTQNSTVVSYREECAGLVAVKLSHDRVTHRAWDCEFRAFARTAAAARALLAGLPMAHAHALLDSGAAHDDDRSQMLGQWHGEASVEGLICVYMTEVPCLSCVCAMLQFRRRFPGVAVEVDWEGLPATVNNGIKHVC